MNLKINHRLGIVDVKYFNDFKLVLKYDSVASTFGFKFYFDPKNKTHAELACVSHYHEAIVEHNGETLVTGYILSEVFSDNPAEELVEFGGYSKPGVLEDCDIPTSQYPLQTDGLTLGEIASKLIADFKLKLIIDPSVSQKVTVPIEKSTADVSQNIKSYLMQLTTQRNVVMTHNEKGDLIFTKASPDLKPIFRVEKGVIATKMNVSFSGQGIHSHITVVKQADSEGGNAGEYTIANPYCPIVFRPKVITQTSGDDITVEETAMNALAAELKNIQLKIDIDRWTVDGKIIRPGNIIEVYDPKLFIYKKANWFIEQVEFTGNSQKETAVLTCVLPEVYNGQMPKNIFVDPHQNLPRI